MNPLQAHQETGPIAFAERVLTLLDQGAFTATYKYAVLLGIIDVCMERVTRTGVPPDTVTTRQLAEKIVELYWPQTIPYPRGNDTAVLRQNTRGQAEIVSLTQQFRSRIAHDPFAPLHRARIAAPDAFERLIRNVEWKLIEMPLPRLQTIGLGEDRFLYEISWDQDVSLADVRQYQEGGPDDDFDNSIKLKANIAEYLIQLNGVLRPFIHRQWAAMVARVNRMEEDRLERFLFGTERVDLGPVRHALLDLQQGKCFYCNTRVRQHAHVDHFIPWSRYPDDALDNLVVADQRCNSAKRDFLASARHVAKWRERTSHSILDEIAAVSSWFRHADATLGVVRAVYLRLPAHVRLWDGGKEFVENVPGELRKALG